MKSKQRILFGCYAMVLAIIGDYLLGYGTIGTTSDPDAYMGISCKVDSICNSTCGNRRRVILAYRVDIVKRGY